MSQPVCVILLHGTYGNPAENWIPSVADGLRQNGATALTPNLPSPVGQDFVTWSSVLDSYRTILEGASKAAIVAHSSACSFAVRYLADRAISVDLLVFVSGFGRFVSGLSDFDKLNAAVGVERDSDLSLAVERAARRISFSSENDPYLPSEIIDTFVKGTESERVSIPDGGHFNTEAGFSSFDALLSVLKGGLVL